MSHQSPCPRSIPAHAGEPESWRGLRHRWKVYPRPRGGAGRLRRFGRLALGLSPPTRGSRGSAVESPAIHRSIPAHAGEPRYSTLIFPIVAVYPRPRGGATASYPPLRSALKGLSPPTRGSPVHFLAVQVNTRSIPAHAGEPLLVYCLSLSPPTRRHDLIPGLSPPTRGSRPGAATALMIGEVYPRPRGGAEHQTNWTGAITMGLSPPTRGSR